MTIAPNADVPETIERAAIRHRGRVYATNSMQHEAVTRAMRAAGVPGEYFPAAQKGCITSHGRFVTDAAGVV